MKAPRGLFKQKDRQGQTLPTWWIVYAAPHKCRVSSYTRKGVTHLACPTPCPKDGMRFEIDGILEDALSPNKDAARMRLAFLEPATPTPAIDLPAPNRLRKLKRVAAKAS